MLHEPLPLSRDLQNQSLVGQVFAYQQTKRLAMLIDQIAWSTTLGLSHAKTVHPVHSHLQTMLEEARYHIAALADGLKGPENQAFSL